MGDVKKKGREEGSYIKFVCFVVWFWFCGFCYWKLFCVVFSYENVGI